MPSTARRTHLASLLPVVVVWLAAALIAGRSVNTWAAEWRVQTGITAQETLTDNVRLQPEGQATSDLITEIAPSIRLNGDGERLKLNFAYSPHLVVHARNTEDSAIAHTLSAGSRAEVVENLFFFDADAQVGQNFISPFGTTQADLGTINQNRVETYLARLSPYFKGNFGPYLAWQARNDTIWTWTSGSAFAANRQVGWSASMETPVRLVGARTEYRRNEGDSSGQRTLTTDVFRTYLYFQPRSSIRLSAIGGYE